MRDVDATSSYVHEALPGRVVFGAGSVAQVPAELAALGCRRVLVLAGGASRSIGAALVDALGGRAAGHVDRLAQHVPADVVAAAVEAATATAADGLCSVGGGSATGLAKAVAVELGLPILAVPTTYAGSEATPVYGITEGRHKRTARDARALPRTVVYDPELTTGLPPGATAASAFNALAQAVAALVDGDYDPVAGAHAEAAVAEIVAALPTAVARPDDLDARAALLHGAHLAGRALAVARTGLHHKACHAIGGHSGLVHADIHAVLLPYSLAVDEAVTPAARARVARALAAAEATPVVARAPDQAAAQWPVDPDDRLAALARAVGIPDSLAAIGLPAAALDDVAAATAAALPATHPRAGDTAWVRGFLAAAHRGDPLP